MFVGFTLRNQLKHSFFAGSQACSFSLSHNGCVRRVLIVFAKVLGDRWAEKTLSLVHLANGFDENVGGGLLNQKSRSAKQDNLLDVLGIGMGRKNEHPRCGSCFADLPSRLKPFSSGMAMSMTTTLGCSCIVMLIASRPVFASPTTVMSPSVSTSFASLHGRFEVEYDTSTVLSGRGQRPLSCGSLANGNRKGQERRRLL